VGERSGVAAAADRCNTAGADTTVDGSADLDAGGVDGACTKGATCCKGAGTGATNAGTSLAESRCGADDVAPTSTSALAWAGRDPGVCMSITVASGIAKPFA
jgi:hypothetical protein